jgi:hypothetical protein
MRHIKTQRFIEAFAALSPEVKTQARKAFELFCQDHPLLVGDLEIHWKRFLEASLQRLMQALGAYCNLSRNKGIPSFARHISPGVKRLKCVLEASSLPLERVLAPLLSEQDP